MKSQFSRSVVSLLALLGSTVAMGATVTITPSNTAPLVGETFTLTVQSDVVDSLAATMSVSYDATKVEWLSGAMPADGPYSGGLGGTYIKNTAYTSPSVFDIVTNAETSLADGTYDAVILTFMALAVGDANIVINDDGGNCCGWFSNPEAEYIPVDYTQANVTVAAAGAANVVVTDAVVPMDDLQLPFGEVTEGATSATRTVTVTNSGTLDLVVGTIALADALAGPFTVFSDNCSGQTLTPGTPCTVGLEFSPTSTGSFEDTFDIPTSDVDEPSITFTVLGAGTPIPVPNVVVTDPIDPLDDNQVPFGSVVQNQTSLQTLTVSNEGTANLVLGLIATADPLVAPFSVVNDNCSGETVAPLGNCTFQVEFLPTAVGAFSDTLDIPSDDPDSPSVTVSVSGTGAPVPVANIAVADSTSPTDDRLVDFGDVNIPNSAEEIVTVTNAGTASLVLGDVASVNPVVAPFSIVTENCSGQTLAPAASCTITVAFAPDAIEPSNEAFDIPSNDPDEPGVTVAVSGSGMPERTSGGGSSALDPVTLMALGILGFAVGRRAKPARPTGTSV